MPGPLPGPPSLPLLLPLPLQDLYTEEQNCKRWFPCSDVHTFPLGKYQIQIPENPPKGFDPEVLGEAQGICMSKTLPRVTVMWVLPEANMGTP